MPNPGQVMEEISRVLKPNGILLAPTFLWKEGMKKQILKTLTAFSGFKVYQVWDKKDFEDFIEGYGFSLVEMKLVYGGFSPIGVMVGRKVPQEFL